MKPICFTFAFITLFLSQLAIADNTPSQVPGWLHEGQVFTSTWMYVRSPRSDCQYHELPDGRWCDDSGNIFAESDVHGTSASGVAQTTVTCIDGDKIATVTRSFADMRATGLPDPMPLQNAATAIGRLADDSDNWIDPAKLAAVQSDSSKGLLVEPVQWKRPEGMRDAIRISFITPDGFTVHVFDKKTGISVHYAKWEKHAPLLQGQSVLTQGDLLTVRGIKVPWSHEDVPTWVNEFKAVHYRGKITFRNSPLVPVPNQITFDAWPVNHGDGWAMVKTSLIVQYQNAIPSPPTQGKIVFGRSEFGGFWAGPNALAKLQQGDVLDEDPITKMRTVVTQVGDRVVTISQANNSGEIVSAYNKQTGMLIGSSYYSAATRQDWAVKLIGQE